MVKASNTVTLCPKGLDMASWLSAINEAKSVASYFRGTLRVVLPSNITLSDFSPAHIVSLSAIISLAKQHDNKVVLAIADKALLDFVENNAQIHAYWSGRQLPYYASPDYQVMNLWHITGSHLDSYAYTLSKYFAREFFSGLDLYALQNSLVELYQNIFDHADATGNAFSYVCYDASAETIRVAVCDLGIGIAESLRRAGLVNETDDKVLAHAIQFGVSAQSKAHNGGFGLDNIRLEVGNEGQLLIVANSGMLQKLPHLDVETSLLPFSFGGTLISMDIPVSQLSALDDNDQENFML